MCEQSFIQPSINQPINQPSAPPTISNAATDHRISRPGGVDASAGGTAGGTCSSPGGRSRVAVGQQREGPVVQIPGTGARIYI